MADVVQLAGGDAGIYMLADHVQHFSGQFSGAAHAIVIFGFVDGDGADVVVHEAKFWVLGFRLWVVEFFVIIAAYAPGCNIDSRKPIT